eukprot:TRINITY_DN2893_c0_g1_i1.p1 TRINITY_DN2893_c0_g1~~TRINITY_DN2893_c0_g1_i1.p1  ORF type:complete len:569 (-),score=81.90 TRINITY_DN2893_c0_g1_i1:66-1772(-)
MKKSHLLSLLLLSVFFSSFHLLECISVQNPPSWVPSEILNSRFRDSISLDQKYYLFWNITSKGDIIFGVSAQTNGWVALGLSPNGGMRGADIWTVRSVDGVFVVEDRFSPDFVTPVLDSTQDVKILWASRNNGATSFIIQRRLESCDDSQDLDISNKSIAVAYAISAEDDDQFTKHGQIRGSLHLNFFLPKLPQPPPSNMSSITIQTTNFRVPKNHSTTYTCQGFTIDANITSKVHILYIENLVRSPLVHHMILYVCESETAKEIRQCNMEIACAEFFTVFAKGAPNYIPPEGVGIPLLPHQKHFMLQQHYENPEGLDVVDNSGFRMYYTQELKKHDQGTMLLGNFLVSIPPSQDNFEVIGDCPSTCTEKKIPSDGITVVNIEYHMHALGFKGWTQVIRNGTELTPLGSLSRYDFNFQTFWDMQPYKLYPGDRIITHCVWSSRNKKATTVFGEGTDDEMCFDMVVYYPKVSNMDTCIQIADQAMCGDKPSITMSSNLNLLTMVPLNPKPYTPYVAPQCAVPSATNQTVYIQQSTTRAPTTPFPSDSSSHRLMTSFSVFFIFISIFLIC